MEEKNKEISIDERKEKIKKKVKEFLSDKTNLALWFWSTDQFLELLIRRN